jgi:hypothetical protein
MTNHIYRNKKDFAREEFATEFHGGVGIPKPRESQSQKAQIDSLGTPGEGRKDKKEGMAKKTGLYK